MDTQVLSYAMLALVAAGLAAFFIYQKRKQGQKPDIAAEIALAVQAAPDVVAAVRQLHESGQIDLDERFDWAFDALRPYAPNLSPALLEAIIESAYYYFKQGVEAFRALEE